MATVNPALSYERGWSVRSGFDPADVPVWLAGKGWHYLTPDGGVTPATEGEQPMDEFKQYRRSQIAEMADWEPGFDMAGVSVSPVDRDAGSPKLGDKIARNPKNHDDRWLVAAHVRRRQLRAGRGRRVSTRHIIVVDCESSGLRDEDIAVEIAWHDLTSGEQGSFVPCHNRDWVMNFAEPRALEVNGYIDRLADAEQDDGTQARALYALLDGNTLAGSNPTADAGWLEHAFIEVVDLSDVDPKVRRPAPFRPWHHRMLDLSAYAAGVLGLDPAELPGLWDVCQILGVDPEPDVHSAAAGVAVTVACLRELFVKAGVSA